MRSLSLVASMLVLAGCSVNIPNGELRCGADEPCPPGYACESARCYAPGTDAGERADAGLHDGGADASVDASADGGADAPAPVEVFSDVACGNVHSCAVTSMGRVFCWGDDRGGQIGDDTTADAIPITRPVQVVGLSNIDEVALGDDFTCALAVGDAIYCWGTNNRGQLGDASVGSVGTASPHRVPRLTAPTALAVGVAHACAIVEGPAMGGEVRCWGQGDSGQLGNGASSNRPDPVAVVLPAPAVDIAAGIAHTCALLEDRTVWCWGNNTRAELGLTVEPLVGTESPLPLLLTGLPAGIDAIEAFAAHTCVRAGGRLRCWGWNESGELGSGSATPTSSAETVEVTVPPGALGDFGGDGFIIFGGAHTCAVVGASLYCWGRSLNGEVGVGTNPFSPILTPSLVSLTGVTRVSGGTVHTCAVASGAVHCWGYNERGRLGNGSETSTNIPGEPVLFP